MARKMIPYSVFLPEEYHTRLKEMAKGRRAAGLIRDALMMLFEGGDAYKSGYNKGLADASKVIYESKEAQMIAVNKRDLGAVLADQIDALKKP